VNFPLPGEKMSYISYNTQTKEEKRKGFSGAVANGDDRKNRTLIIPVAI